MATLESANAKGNAGIALGSTAVGIEVLRALGGGNVLGGLFGGNNNGGNAAATMAAAAAAFAAGAGNNHCGECSENHVVNRYELGLVQEIAAKDSQIALRDANTYQDQKSLEMYKYFDAQLKDVRDRLCDQAVVNQRTADSFERVHDDLVCCKSNLEAQIAAERSARCCADNSIVNYVNATFYPKMVADVTTGTTTTAQSLYDPLPNCNCNCNKGCSR